MVEAGGVTSTVTSSEWYVRLQSLRPFLITYTYQVRNDERG